MFRTLLVISLLLPLACLAQYTVSGRVLNISDKKPVANASVFLSNTLVGAKTGEDGSFTLREIKQGQYDLVVSIIGYETFHLAVMVNGDAALANIEISPKTIILKEVRIIPEEEQARNYATFKRLFLGTSAFAEECKILNPDALTIDYDKPGRVLTAKSSDFIEIENAALGYKIKYLLSNFTDDAKSGILNYEGSALFEVLKGSKRQERKWAKNRLAAYKGSSMDFLRSVTHNDLDKEGFKVLRLIRKLNPGFNGDLNKKYKETLVTTPLTVVDFVKLTNIKGQYALAFNDCLYVMYNKKQQDAPVDNLIKGDKVPDYLTDYSTTTIIFETPYALFDTNGIFVKPESILFEGDWGRSRMAELLPVDYEPVG